MFKVIIATFLIGCGCTTAALAEGKKIGVSWSNFQSPRWKFDAAAMRSAIERDGNIYVTTTAEGSAEKQLDDVEGMIAEGVDALIILPVDSAKILPAVEMATEAGIPVISYDRLIDSEHVFYVSFDNVSIGWMIAAIVRQARPEGNYVVLKGDPADANVAFVRKGMEEVIGTAVAGGEITVVGEKYADGWKADNAYAAMVEVLDETKGEVDAVLAQNDRIAGAAIKALSERGMMIPVGGQDGSPEAINRVARGLQTVTVWKNTRELGKLAGKVAGLLAEGTPMDRIPDSVGFEAGEKGITFNAILLTATPITRENLNIVIEAGNVTRKEACAGALPGVPGC